ncbi:MAG: DUF4926 domain-containing protein [Clostridiales Family XIII bacterium]|jgi:hypothetical protein|nr:DUF4926 domain-containing protein [Clostridiales Family XIII bacterium]
MFNLFDIVKLKSPKINLGITSNDIGAIVYIHNDGEAYGEAYTVEFLDSDNETIMESLFMEFTPDELTLVKKDS